MQSNFWTKSDRSNLVLKMSWKHEEASKFIRHSLLVYIVIQLFISYIGQVIRFLKDQ